MGFRTIVASFAIAMAFAGAPAGAVINGNVANGLYTGVASLGGCSAVLVAPRVLLTSAHCFMNIALGCAPPSGISVVFAEPGGGWVDQASYDSRVVAVQGYIQRPEIFDLSVCTTDDQFNCAASVRDDIDHSQELVVLYLADEAPADAVPLPIFVHPLVDFSDSAGSFGTLLNMSSWIEEAERIVTTVGYGVGSEAYALSGGTFRGRNYGVQTWIAAASDFAAALGVDTCNLETPTVDRPGVVVSPSDFELDDIGVHPDNAIPGDSYPPSVQSHSGTGDSGGPVLIGPGAASNDTPPSRLPPPGPGESYDRNRQYIAGTASIWVGSGQMLATAFTPTWTLGASNFLKNALHDSDGDGYADPVDDDRDGDGCSDDIDQNPDDRFVEVGTSINLNCSPSQSPILGDESIDSDGDGMPNCEDRNDDNDTLLDFQDPCPLVKGAFCFQFGATCPWNREFFDCRLGGCNEIEIRFSSVVNPDPTSEVLFPVLSWTENTVVVGAAPGLSIEQSAQVLSGAALATLFGFTTDLFVLEVVGPAGEIRGTIAGYGPGEVRIGDLEGAEALVLHFGTPGSGLLIDGFRTPPAPVPSTGVYGLIAALTLMSLVAGRAIRRRS